MSYSSVVSRSMENILRDALSGKYPVAIGGLSELSVFGDGFSVNLGENKLEAYRPNTRNIVSITPEASILVKKKAFTSYAANNDLRFMDKTEKMLLRATKALFALKCAQIRTYESLTKFEDSFRATHQINLALFVNMLNDAKNITAGENLSGEQGLSLIFGAISNTLQDLAYDDYKEDVLKIIKRNAFSTDIKKTTWIVDPESTNDYEIGPGTGVIDLCTFTDLSTTCSIETSPSPASFSLEDPYRILTITEADIETAIDEAVNGTVGLLQNLLNGDPNAPLLDASSIISAGIEAAGLGILDPSLDMAYIRNRLRVFYLGKSIVNPGDGIHIYIKSEKVVQDYSDLSGMFDEEYFEIDESILEAERILYTNGKIDLETYKKLRRSSTNSLQMTHVFGGFVKDVGESFSGSKWTLKVNCTDNMGWLQRARFNIEPALDDAQGVLEDPLTPYYIETDESGRVLSASGPQLLEENKELLRSGLLRYDSGILNGQVATESNLLQGQFNEGGSLKGSKVLQHPNGFVYRWKSGIITATANLSVTDPINEDTVSMRRHRQVYGLPVTATDSSAMGVLNNLDIANVLSILIVGQPYNVESFMEQAYMSQGLRATSSSNMQSANAVTSVLDAVRKQNRFLGDFRPYRMITMSKQTLEEGTSSYIMRTKANESIEVLRRRKVELSQVLKRLSASPVSGGSDGLLYRSISTEIKDIDASISKLTKPFGNIELDAADFNQNNFNLFGRSRNLSQTGNTNFDHQITRAMTLVGTNRRIEDTRLNRDSNLFIVSDQYDENTDIRPYLLKFRDSNYKIFKGIYASVYEKCEAFSKVMNLEFFCAPSGHLVFRPPQWNKTPLSVMRQLFKAQKQGIVPGFLKDLFGNRTESLRREIHGLNIRIVLLSLLMGKYPDKTIIPGMVVGGAEALAFFGVSENSVESGVELGLTIPGSKGFSLGDIQNLDDQLVGSGLSVSFTTGEEGDTTTGNTSRVLGTFDPVFQEAGGSVFDSVVNTVGNPGGAPALRAANADNLNLIRDEYRKISGGDPGAGIKNDPFESRDFVFEKGEEDRAIEKLNKYLSLLSSTISERDKMVELLKRNEEKQEELEELESVLSGEFLADESNAGLIVNVGDTSIDFGKVQDKLERISRGIDYITDIFTGDSNKGTVFDHLISDDERNLKGPGSGRRFVIQDHDIKNCSFSEQPPDFTRVDVNGNAPIVGSGLNSAFEERYYWAGATDFDMWRQYGYKYSVVEAPFSSNAELQSRPFAIMELQIQRTKVNQGTVTVVGNEFYEPGDVVFVKSKGLLYYVTSVNHSFSYASKDFSTTLTLNNGHPPGEYLPSPLDIIGQQLTKNPFSNQAITYRNPNGDDKYRELRPDSSILFPNNVEITKDNIAVLLDSGDNMVRFANMMIELGTLLIGNKKVLLRGFVRRADDVHRSEVESNISIIKSLLMNPRMISQYDSSSLGDDFVDDVTKAAAGLFGGSASSSKSLKPLRLPNGLQAFPIPAESIVEQIVILDGLEATSEIRCMDQELLTAQTAGIFPLGGPKQSSWVSIRDDLTKISKIVEIGILDINRKLEDLAAEKENTIGGGEISPGDLNKK